jgi:hypothetical protein
MDLYSFIPFEPNSRPVRVGAIAVNVRSDSEYFLKKQFNTCAQRLSLAGDGLQSRWSQSNC